jgi:hypothetical protein
MIKKFFAKLVGWQEQRTGADRFHDRENIERENAKERAKMAQINEQERLRRQRETGVEVEAPMDQEILGPSEEETEK